MNGPVTIGQMADALADALDLLEETLPADHAALRRITATAGAAEVAMAHDRTLWHRTLVQQ